MKVELVGKNIFITVDGVEKDPIPSGQTRFRFLESSQEVVITDELLPGTFKALVNTIVNDADAVISNVDYATDRAAVKAYLAEIIGG